MRVLLAGFGSRGDLQPLFSLALSLHSDGHEVQMAGPPDFAPWASELALPYQSVGGSMAEAVARASSGARALMGTFRDFRALLRTQFEVLLPLARKCDVMVGSTMAVSGPAFAEKLGIRFHAVAFTPAVIASAEHPALHVRSQTLPRWLNRLTWGLNRRMNDAIFREPVNQGRRDLGLGPIQDLWAHLYGPGLMIASDPALSPLPGDSPVGTVQLGTWFLPEPDELPPELEDFLAAGPPPVYLGFGSMPTQDPAATTRRLLEAVRRSGVRALLSRGAGNLGAGQVPAGVRTIGPVAHGKLFPRCAAVVHHGGAGTTATAARAGVPQIVIPQMTDQHYWRHRVWLRGLTPRPVASKPDELSDAMRVCIADSALRERARTFATTMMTDGAQRASKLITQQSFG